MLVATSMGRVAVGLAGFTPMKIVEKDIAVRCGNVSRFPSAGFTLVELLAVIAIVGVLVALVVAGLSRVKQSAKSSECLSNLRQLGLASNLYSSDNSGYLLPMCQGTTAQLSALRTWRGLLLPYIKDGKVLICPSETFDADRYPGLDSATKATGIMPTSYGMNGYGMNTTSPHDYFTYTPRKKSMAISNPASQIFLCDAGVPDSVSPPLDAWTENNRLKTTPSFGYALMSNQWASGAFTIYPRHQGTRTNVLFYDGHVASLDLAKDIVARPPSSGNCPYDYH